MSDFRRDEVDGYEKDLNSNRSLIEKLEAMQEDVLPGCKSAWNAAIKNCIGVIRQHEATQPSLPSDRIPAMIKAKAEHGTTPLSGTLIEESALDEALLTLRPQVWQDITQQVILGEIPAAQLPMKVEMWFQNFRPYLKRAIEVYLKSLKPSEITEQKINDIKYKMTEAIYERIKMKRPNLPPGNGEAMAYANAALDIVKPYLKRESGNLKRIKFSLEYLHNMLDRRLSHESEAEAAWCDDLLDHVKALQQIYEIEVQEGNHE